METAKIFRNGRSQAVRLPKAYRVTGDEVKISRQGRKIVLEPLDARWDHWFASWSQFSDDFLAEGRHQPRAQERHGL